jgi:HSP20 family molecular chaperone IbpA
LGLVHTGFDKCLSLVVWRSSLRGERKGETEDKNRHISERYYGRFERRTTLPAEVEEDKVRAASRTAC